MNKPHKWAEVIKAWADGAIVQYYHINNVWCDVVHNKPVWDVNTKYRVKPELKDPALVLKEAWYKSLFGRDTEDGNMREWTAAAKALIQAYKAGELKDF